MCGGNNFSRGEGRTKTVQVIHLAGQHGVVIEGRIENLLLLFGGLVDTDFGQMFVPLRFGLFTHLVEVPIGNLSLEMARAPARPVNEVPALALTEAPLGRKLRLPCSVDHGQRWLEIERVVAEDAPRFEISIETDDEIAVQMSREMKSSDIGDRRDYSL